MARAVPAQPVKLICALLAGRVEWLDQTADLLATEFGPADLVSAILPHNFTEYYLPQMGPGLLRRLISFERLIDPAELGRIKLRTNELEADLAGRIGVVDRPVNIDPGYIAPSKLVLASAKDFAHRTYLHDGIYAEITLQYREKSWRPLPWTFPDYGSGQYDAFLSDVRSRLLEQG